MTPIPTTAKKTCMKITINDKGQIYIPAEIRAKMEELEELLHAATSDLSHIERFFALSYITELIKDVTDWKRLFKIT
jgi:bifunctional DNA-binding transcriptional regulator/antitoxin component of YhaV-PrlF toxin-antitoxin module